MIAVYSVQVQRVEESPRHCFIVVTDPGPTGAPVGGILNHQLVQHLGAPVVELAAASGGDAVVALDHAALQALPQDLVELGDRSVGRHEVLAVVDGVDRQEDVEGVFDRFGLAGVAVLHVDVAVGSDDEVVAEPALILAQPLAQRHAGLGAVAVRGGVEVDVDDDPVHRVVRVAEHVRLGNDHAVVHQTVRRQQFREENGQHENKDDIRNEGENFLVLLVNFDEHKLEIGVTRLCSTRRSKYF